MAVLRSRLPLNVACASLTLTISSSACLAQKVDLEFGRYLATECLTCHRSATVGGAIPNIFGMSEPRFTVLIKAYRDKQLPNPVMQSVASRLKDDEIDALAHYFAVTKKP
jgi:cytochrome c